MKFKIDVLKNFIGSYETDEQKKSRGIKKNRKLKVFNETFNLNFILFTINMVVILNLGLGKITR